MVDYSTFDYSNRETRLKGAETEVVIGPCRPAAIIGDRITAELVGNEDMGLIKEEAISQARDGADVINVALRCHGLDQERLAPLVVQAVADAVSLPICIETDDPAALAAALQVCPGKPLVNAISGSQVSLQQMLPLAVRRGAAVIGVAEDDDGVPAALEERVEAGRHVLRMCITAGIAREDVILDPLARSLQDDRGAALTTLEAIAQLARIEAVNLALRPRGICNGLPDGESIITVFSALAARHGATSLIMDPARGRRAALIADLLLGKDGAMEQYVEGSLQRRVEI